MKKLLYIFVATVLSVVYGINAYADGGVKIYKNGSFTTIYANEIDSLVFFDDTNYSKHEYVDLGLPSGIKWATCNVGADLPWDKGDFYAWGEIEPKSDYSASTYKFYSNGYTKYGTIDGKYRLEKEDDVAQCLWGTDWRMPTYEELQELKEYCSFTWVDQDDICAVKATGPNGNFIYLPLPGNYTGSYIYFEGSVGSYWSCDLQYDSYAKDLDFGKNSQSLNGDTRYHGQSVRPVYVGDLKNDSENKEFSLQTIIFNDNVQPPIVGGIIHNSSSQVIIEKGIIVSIDKESVQYDNSVEKSDPYFYQDEETPNDRYNSLCSEDYRIIDCTQIGEEQFWISLKLLKANTTYYVRAYVVKQDNTILYGDIEEIHSADFSRYSGRADYANVWYAFGYTTFDLITDEIINPTEGFYYSTNESPQTVRYQKGTSYNTCYKFATEWNYKLWYYHNLEFISKESIVNVPIMKLINSKLEITKNPKDANKNITIYYSINGNGDRPETFSNEYATPLNVGSNDVVYCYAMDNNGMISYTNMYVVIK